MEGLRCDCDVECGFDKALYMCIDRWLWRVVAGLMMSDLYGYRL